MTSGKPRAASIYFALTALREVNRPTDEQGWKAFAGRERIAWAVAGSFANNRFVSAKSLDPPPSTRYVNNVNGAPANPNSGVAAGSMLLTS